MALTKADRDHLGDLLTHVERLPQKPKPIEGDRFEMQNPADAIRERIRKEATREQRRQMALWVAVYFGAVVAGFSLSAVAFVHLVKP